MKKPTVIGTAIPRVGFITGDVNIMAFGAAAYKRYEQFAQLDIDEIFDMAVKSAEVSTTVLNGFTTEAFINTIHPKIPGKKRQGQVAFLWRVGDGEDGKGEFVTSYSSTDTAADFAKQYLSVGQGRDLYVSMNTFMRRREVNEICAIQSTYVDLDYHNTSLIGRKPEAVANNVIKDLKAAGKPLPSFVLSTGRGLLCVWLHEMLGRKVLKKWNAVQKEIPKVLEAFGPDKGAADGARVFRLVGSVNSKADHGREHVRLIWGDPANLHRYRFNDLADAWLPLTKAELISITEERAKANAKKKVKPRTNGKPRFDGLWGTRLADIEKLIDHRYPSGAIAKGMQDKFLFVFACGLAQTMTDPETMLPSLRAKATKWAGGSWSDLSVTSSMGAAYRRALDAVNGLTVEFDGKQVDPRYRFRSSTIVEWLEISEAEMIGADLRDLCSSDIKAERSADRARAWRFETKGQKTSHEEQRREKLVIGREAIALRDQGKSYSDIEIALNRSRSFIHASIKLATVDIDIEVQEVNKRKQEPTSSRGATHYTPFESRTPSFKNELATGNVVEFRAEVDFFPGDLPIDTQSAISLDDAFDVWRTSNEGHAKNRHQIAGVLF